MNESYGVSGINEILNHEHGPKETGVAFQDLASVLEREIECYTDLLEAARSEQKAIIYGKLNELKLAIEAEENLIASTRALDEIRRNTVSLIARSMGRDGTGLTLKEIIESVDPEEKERLGSLRERLRKTTKDLEFVNRANAQLIKSSVDFINETMWILLHVNDGKESTYDSSGKGQQQAKRKVLVDKLG